MLSRKRDASHAAALSPIRLSGFGAYCWWWFVDRDSRAIAMAIGESEKVRKVVEPTNKFLVDDSIE